MKAIAQGPRALGSSHVAINKYGNHYVLVIAFHYIQPHVDFIDDSSLYSNTIDMEDNFSDYSTSSSLIHLKISCDPISPLPSPTLSNIPTPLVAPDADTLNSKI